MTLPSFRSISVVALAFAGFACSHDDKPANTGYEPAMTPASRAATSAPETLGAEPSERLDDRQIVSVLRSVNVAEVDQARTASGKLQNASAKKLAEMMIAQHGKAVKDIDALTGKLGYEHEDSQLATELGIESTRVEQELARANESTIDRLYIMGQVDTHRQALDAIDTRLIPAARHDDVKNLLQTTRPIVAHHLEAAQQILDTLK